MTFESESIKYSNQLIVILKAEFYEGTEYLSNREKSITVSSVLTHVRPDVISFGSISRSVSDIDGNFEISDISIRLDNSGGRFSAFDLERLFNADCTLTMGFINDQYADHKTIFVGSIYDYEFNNNELIISIKDYVSKKLDVKFGHYIDGDDWPNASADIVGLRMPIVYGDIYKQSIAKIIDIYINRNRFYGIYSYQPLVVSDGNGRSLIVYNPSGSTNLVAVLSFNNGSLILSNTLTLLTTDAEYWNAIYDPTNDLFLIAYTTGFDLYCKTISISSYSIYQSSQQLINSNFVNLINLVYDTTNDLIILAFKCRSSSSYSGLTLTSQAGSFLEGETVIGLSSGATSLFYRQIDDIIYVYNVTGTYQLLETVQGTTTFAIGDIINSQSIGSAFDYKILSIDISSGISLGNQNYINNSSFTRSDPYYFLEYDPINNYIYASYRMITGGSSQIEICQVSGSDINILDFQDDINLYIGASETDTVIVWKTTFDTTNNFLIVIFSIVSDYFCSGTYFDTNESDFYPAFTEYHNIGDIEVFNSSQFIYDSYSNSFFLTGSISGDMYIVGALYSENSINFNASRPIKIGNGSIDQAQFLTSNGSTIAMTYVDTDGSWIQYFDQIRYINVYIPIRGMTSSKCYCIDTLNNIWIVAGHQVKEIGNVYTTDIENNQDLLSIRTDTITKTVDYSYVGGLNSKIAIIQFTTNAPLPTDIVNVDCQGMIDGSSNLIENPITALEHFLINYLGFTSADYDITSFTSAETDSEDWLIANVILPNEKYSAKELIEKWASSLGAVVGFNFDGKLIIKIMG